MSVAAKLVFVLLALPAVAAAHGDQAHSVLFTNGTWFDGERFVPRTFYSVAGKLRAAYAGAVEDTIDLAVGCVVPPFADAHTHAFSETAGVERDARRFLTAGILFAKNPNNPASQVAAVRALTNRPLTNRPQTVDVWFANGGLTATGGHPTQIYEPERGATRWADDAYVAIDDAKMLERKWPRVLAAKPDFIKVYLERSERHALASRDSASYGTYGIDPKLLPDVVARAHRAKLPVACHVTTAADFRTAVAAGVDEIHHLPLESITEADARAASQRSVTVVTTLVSHKSNERGPAIDAMHRANLELLKGAGVRLALGTDHPALTVIDEAQRLRDLHVFDDAAILRLLTRETLYAIAPKRDAGRLDDGREASFLVLDGNPLEDFAALRRVRLRMKAGVHIEPPKPTGKPAIAEAILPAIMRGEIDVAFAQYDSLRAAQSDAYDFSEQQLNQLGYAMLRHGQARGAVRMFEKNAELFPRSINVWDSLADGCLAAGDTARAAVAFGKVIETIAALPHRSAAMEKLEARAREQLALLGRSKD